MNRLFKKVLTLACLMAAVGAARAQEPKTATVDLMATNISSFDILSTHNIFDPNRSGPRRYTPPPRQRQVDWFAPVGTMSYEKGTFAFFDGNNSNYRKTLKTSDTIAGYKITGITPDSIQLAAASNKVINLPIGTRMRRYDGGHWAVAGATEAMPDSSSTTTTVSSDTMPAPAASGGQDSPPSSAADNDIMKKLMLKRLQEK
jgi:hypothetical protein